MSGPKLPRDSRVSNCSMGSFSSIHFCCSSSLLHDSLWDIWDTGSRDEIWGVKEGTSISMCISQFDPHEMWQRDAEMTFQMWNCNLVICEKLICCNLVTQKTIQLSGDIYIYIISSNMRLTAMVVHWCAGCCCRVEHLCVESFELHCAQPHRDLRGGVGCIGRLPQRRVLPSGQRREVTAGDPWNI